MSGEESENLYLVVILISNVNFFRDFIIASDQFMFFEGNRPD
jgi:hypothetical protein